MSPTHYFTATLSCGHQMDYPAVAPVVGDRIYCRRCGDWAKCEASPDWKPISAAAAKYVPKPPVEFVDLPGRNRCTGTTGRGRPCGSVMVRVGETLCRWHQAAEVGDQQL